MSASGWSAGNNIYFDDALNPTQFTLAARVKLNPLVSSIPISRGDGGFSHEIQAVTNWIAYIWTGASTTDTGPAVSADWQTVVATFDEGVAVEMWVDGVSNGATAGGGLFWTGGTRWWVGCRAGGSTPVDGSIAWATMWPRVLTPGEIKTLGEYHPRYVPRARWLVDLLGASPVIHADKLAVTRQGTLTMSKDNPRILG